MEGGGTRKPKQGLFGFSWLYLRLSTVSIGTFIVNTRDACSLAAGEHRREKDALDWPSLCLVSGLVSGGSVRSELEELWGVSLVLETLWGTLEDRNDPELCQVSLRVPPRQVLSLPPVFILSLLPLPLLPSLPNAPPASCPSQTVRWVSTSKASVIPAPPWLFLPHLLTTLLLFTEYLENKL